MSEREWIIYIDPTDEEWSHPNAWKLINPRLTEWKLTKEGGFSLTLENAIEDSDVCSEIVQFGLRTMNQTETD